jgi:hypothetical protein
MRICDRSRRGVRGFAACAAVLVAGACGAEPGPRPVPPETGYVGWMADRAWTTDELPAVSAAFSQICSRAAAGDPAAALDAAAMASDLRVVEDRLLPLLRLLPDEDDVPDALPRPSGCPAPDPALVEAIAALDLGDAAPVSALEAGEGGRGIADDARLSRVLTALRIVAEAGGPAGGEPLARAIAMLAAETVVVPADPAELWESLAIEAMDAAAGGEAIDFESLGTAARDRLSCEGFLLRVRRAVKPVSEDTRSNLRELAVEAYDRAVHAWVGADPESGGAPDSTESAE